MKKKIVEDLTSLAHRILRIKEEENILELQAIAKELYEKLTVLVYTENYFSDVKPTTEKQEIESKLDQAFTDAQKDVQSVSKDVGKVMEDAQEEVREAFSSNDLSELFVPEEKDNREEMELPGISTIHKMVIEMPDEALEALENSREESENTRKKLPNRYRDSFTTNSLNDLVVPEEDDREEIDLPGISTINKMVFEMPDEPAEVPDATAHTKSEMDSEPETKSKPEANSEPQAMKTHQKTDLQQLTADFQQMPIFERKSTSQESDRPKSLNSRLNDGMKIGMNDRMGFVKHLFNGSNQDFNRVMSQLNTISSYQEAQNLIQSMVKPDYNNWEGKESYENRFLELIERKYQ
ncbi:hypothetical protein [Nonlabens antarcticus]|uniref:hypothetical protein n=1 Tax=Nonlabens antarcticus TaxID=392714 RepID=UPI001891C28A|nr:hypothetical protein [Nonlabens antarcticus]